MNIQYKIGNILDEIEQIPGPKLLIHIVNNVGGWGGFAYHLNNKWKEPKDNYEYKRMNGLLSLGSVQYVRVTKDIVVANMVAQDNKLVIPGLPLVDYKALYQCFKNIKYTFGISHDKHTTICTVPIGTGIGGGNWMIVKNIFGMVFEDTDQEIIVWDLPACF